MIHEQSFFKDIDAFEVTVKTTLGKVSVEKDGTFVVSDKVQTQEKRVKVAKEAVKLFNLLKD